VLLLVATAFVLTSVVDPNRYRGKIEGIVADLAGRPFVIQGDLAITWYPWLGIRTGAAHLDNAPGVGGPPIVEWQSINVAAKVWPLLHGEIVADRIRLQSPSIHLRRDKQGHGNWEGLGGSQVGGNSAGPTAAGADGSATGAAGAAPGGGVRGAGSTGGPTGRKGSGRQVQIAGVEIRDGTVDYIDEATGMQATLSNLELDVGEWRAGKSLPVHTKFLAHTQSLPPDGVWVQLDAPELAVRPSPLAVTAPKLTVKVANAQADGDLSYEQTADADANAHGSADARAEAHVEAHGSAGAQVAARGPGDAHVAAHGPGDAHVAAHGPGDAHAAAHGPDDAHVAAHGPDDAHVAAHGPDDAYVAAHDSTGTHVKAHGSVVLRTPSLRELANRLALNQSLPHDPTTLGPLELATTWNYDNGSIAAKPLALKLDGVSFSGWLQRSAPPKPMWGFELHGDRIDLSRYVSVDSQNKKPFELPVEALRAIQANGSLIFDQVVLADTHMADVRLKLQTPEQHP